MADYGIKISKNGYSVATTNPAEQTFNSQKNSLKISAEGSFSSTASGSRDVDVAHGLSNTPGYICFFQVDSNGKWYPNFTTEDNSGKNVLVRAFTDGTNLSINIYSDSSCTVKVYYYIFVDPGA